MSESAAEPGLDTRSLSAACRVFQQFELIRTKEREGQPHGQNIEALSIALTELLRYCESPGVMRWVKLFRLVERLQTLDSCGANNGREVEALRVALILVLLKEYTREFRVELSRMVGLDYVIGESEDGNEFGKPN